MITSDLDFLDGPYYIDGKTPIPMESTLINDKYRLESNLANSKCSIVFLAFDIDSNNKICIKFIKRTEDSCSRLKNEISLLLISQNERILRIEDYFSYKEYVCIVTPYAKYGSLHYFITNAYQYGLKEEMASVMMKQMLEAIRYLHGLNIAHRDIKPDNFLVYDSNPYHPNIVLSDMGYAKLFLDGELCTEHMGTPDFSAPEVIAKLSYDLSADIWSLGITLFFMLSGNYPFTAFSLNKKKCCLQIVSGQLNYNLLYSLDISSEAIDLIKKMCHIIPKKRITVEDALLHPFITSSQKQAKKEFEIDKVIFNGDQFDFSVGM